MLNRSLALLVMFSAGGCECGYLVGDTMSACVDVENPDAILELGNPVNVSGPAVDDNGFSAAESSFFCSATDALTHSVVVDAGGVGLLRFRWGQDGVDLATELVAGNIDASFVGPTFNGGIGFALNDVDGLAVAVTSGEAAPTVPGITIAHGDGRGTRVGQCGTMTARAAAVTVAGTTTQVEMGDTLAVELDGAPFTVHAFASGTLDPGWHCTDSGSTLSWALIRD